MKKKSVKVDEDSCIGCTLCTQICPGVFEMMDDGKAKAVHPDGNGESEEKIERAIESCPVSCISFVEKQA